MQNHTGMCGVEGFPSCSEGQESACNAGDPGLIPGSGSSPGEGNGNPFQYSCLENSMDREPGGIQSLGSCGVESVFKAARARGSEPPEVANRPLKWLSAKA